MSRARRFAHAALRHRLTNWAATRYAPCALCWRPARRGGFLLCVKCFDRTSIRPKP